MLTVMPVHTFFDKMSVFPMFGPSGKTQLFIYVCRHQPMFGLWIYIVKY